ncbi:MAG: serine/threonine protein kinase, partial [Pirellulales bacterium]|nr:serine/threonine protein kinase [Pirellulales bacterium]
MVPHWRVIKPGSEPIPGYRVEELLGRGQFGEVWRARSPGDTLVALKFLNLGGAHGWKEFRAVQRVKQIRHPNLMPIIAIWLLDEEGAVISDDLIETIAQQIDQTASPSSTETLVIEPIRQSRRPAQMIIGNLLADQTLGDRLKDCLAGGKQGIPQDELLRYMEEAAKGLDFLNSALHQIGDSQGSVQHCDVKPDNIMLTGGSAIVADFGVAQMMAEAAGGATATSLGGTPAYMAPECFHSKTSHSTDQYSLAVTYYELRTGALPFVEQTYAAVYEAHKNGTLDFTAVSPREQAVLRKATSPDPERRYTSCLEFVMRLREAAAPPVKPRPGRRARVLSLAAILLAMAGGSALYNFVRPPSGADLASVDKQLGQQNLGAAATLAADLTDPKDAATALRKINSHISS